MEVHFKVIGSLLIGLAFIHLSFPKYFKWADDLKPLTLINRQMMVIHTFFIALVLLLMGILCLTSASDLIFTKLGQKISLGFGIFWLARLFIQFFGYSSELWKGKYFETTIHFLFLFIWSYVSIIFMATYFNR